jgi:hypothetical protein
VKVPFPAKAPTIRVAHASRVLVSASRRNSLSVCSLWSVRKQPAEVRDREDALASTRDACATRTAMMALGCVKRKIITTDTQAPRS